MNDFVRQLISLMRQPSIKDQPVGTIGELADRLEKAYQERYYRPRQARSTNIGDQVATAFPRNRKSTW